MAISSFLKTHDELVFNILTDYVNLPDPPPDTSRGSTPYVFANVLASQSYGLYATLNFIANQIGPIPSTSGEFLDRYGEVYNLPRFPDESNGDYYQRIIDRLQNPPSGGNKKDYETWALDRNESFTTDPGPPPVTYYNSIVTVRDAYPVPGNVTIYTIPNDESIIAQAGPPNNEENLRVATLNYIESVRPLGIIGTIVTSAKPNNQSVSVNVVPGTNWDRVNAENEIIAYGAQLAPNETLYISQIICICVDNGALSATMVLPVNDVIPPEGEFFRIATVTLNEVP